MTQSIVASLLWALLGAPLAVAGSTVSDSQVVQIQQTIDTTVWKPFKTVFESLDGDALNLVYAQKVIRVTPEGIDTKNRFKQYNKTRFAANVAQGDRIGLDFWFDSRKTNATTSYDVGFYRMSITAAAGTTEHFYGQFHIVLKKRRGQWKIVQDWDTASIGGRVITAADFERRLPAQF